MQGNNKKNEENNGNRFRGDNDRKKLPRLVYYVESPNDDTVLVGINVIITHDKMLGKDIFVVRWYDTSHERVMTMSEIWRRGNQFAFKRIEREGGGLYYFAPMNLEIYNEKVKKRLIAGADFKSEEEMVNEFLLTIKDEI